MKHNKQPATVPEGIDLQVVEEVTEALAARLGTNASEWPLVRRSFAMLAASKGGVNE